MVEDITNSGVAAGERKQFVERIAWTEKYKKAVSDETCAVDAEATGREL